MLKTTGDILTIEAVRQPNAKLLVPNLHIVIKRVEDEENLWSGYCLDLGMNAYSDKKTPRAICNEIFQIITKMALRMILHHLYKNNAPNLLDGMKNTGDDWYVFNAHNNAKKINELEDSYSALINDDDLKQELSFTTPDEKTIHQMVKRLLKTSYTLKQINTQKAA